MNLIENQLDSIKENLSKRNYEILSDWKDSCLAKKLSEKRVIKLLQMMKQVAMFLNKDLDKTTKKDIESVITQINISTLPNLMKGNVNNFNKIKREKYSEWTQRSYKTIIKAFYKWLEGNDEVFPEKVRWIQKKALALSVEYKTSREQYLKEGILSIDDVKKLIRVATSKRDKALVSFLYESGVRVGELLNIKIKDIKFTKTTMDVTVSGKTGTRSLPLVVSTSYITSYLNDEHPDSGNKEAWLWLTKKKTKLRYGYLVKIVRQLYKNAKINKPCNPHMFRHSRATERSNHWTEDIRRKFFGWTKESTMPSFYSHLTDKSVKDKVEDDHKLNGKKKNIKKFENIECGRCKSINAPTNRFCNNCGFALDYDLSKKIVEIEKEAEEKFNSLSLDARKKIIELLA